MHLIGPAKLAACRAIEDNSATWVEAASFKCDGVVINFYCIQGRVLRCEFDADYDERRIDQVDGSDLKDFMLYHHLL